jgi:hypothetical protein
MLNSVIILVSTVLILLLMAGVLLFFYLRSLTLELNDYWLVVLDNLNLRLDKIPNFLETAKRFTTGQEKLIDDVIRARDESRKLVKTDRFKIQKELDISALLRALLDLQKQFPEFGRDTNFLELKMEFKDLNIAIEKVADVYNEKVRKYNKTFDGFFVLPFAIVFGFRKQNIFEYEA